MKSFKRLLALFILLAMALSALPVSAAFEVTSPEVEVNISAEGTIGTADRYTVELKPEKAEYPMPEGTSGGVFKVSRTGAGTVKIPGIHYESMGIYTYIISQYAGTHPSATEYDRREYVMKVQVIRENEVYQTVISIREKVTKEKGPAAFVNKYAETKVTAKKVWDDANNQDGKREDVTLTLSGTYTADGQANSVTIRNPDRVIAADAEGDDLTVEWTELPVYYKGNEIAYVVTEQGAAEDKDGKLAMTMKDDAPYQVAVTGSAADGFVFTNSHETEKVDISGQKTWADNNNQDGIRPASITVNLLADGKTVASKPVTEKDEWKWTFAGVDKYSAGKEIQYTVSENPVPGYTASSTGFDLTNTHEPDVTDLTVRKVWRNETAGRRPDQITVRLTANGAVVNTVYLHRGNGWSATLTNLPVNQNGQPITYAWQEVTPEGYRLESNVTEGTVTTLTNRQIYRLTIYYRYRNGRTAAPTVVEWHDEGDGYNVVSPVIPGYKADILVVKGTMPGHDVEYIVIYVPENSILIDDPRTPLGLGEVIINTGECFE